VGFPESLTVIGSFYHRDKILRVACGQRAVRLEDFIPMVKTTYNGETFWEANVIPVPDHQIEQVKVNDKEITLSTFLTPQAEKVNTITINVGKAAMNPDDLPNPINSDEDY
ncbi:hypothetical protein VPJ68_04090, partial [Parabacteroides distasonis]